MDKKDKWEHKRVVGLSLGIGFIIAAIKNWRWW